MRLLQCRSRRACIQCSRIMGRFWAGWLPTHSSMPPKASSRSRAASRIQRCETLLVCGFVCKLSGTLCELSAASEEELRLRVVATGIAGWRRRARQLPKTTRRLVAKMIAKASPGKNESSLPVASVTSIASTTVIKPRGSIHRITSRPAVPIYVPGPTAHLNRNPSRQESAPSVPAINKGWRRNMPMSAIKPISTKKKARTRNASSE